jgi:hypothetical protein
MARFVCSGTIDAVQRIAGVDDPRVEATEGVEGAVARASAACVLGFAGLSLAVAFMIGLHWFAPFDPLTSVMSGLSICPTFSRGTATSLMNNWPSLTCIRSPGRPMTRLM